MLKNADAEALMQNARAAQAEGERLWAAGDWRNATDQGWAAVRDATAALALEVNGKLAPVKGLGDPQVNAISGAISDLAQERGGEWERLDVRFSVAYVDLYFYAGFYDDDLGDQVREAADYIRCAEQLAEQAAAAPVADGGQEC